MNSHPRTALPRGLFVTGTDTEVGKTVAAVALLHALGARGVRCAAMKPVAAGCEQTPDGPRNEDALALQAAAGVPHSYEQINPYALMPAVAPHLAAREAGVEISLDHIARAFDVLADSADTVVVEGAGGWLVPLGPEQLFADLAIRLQLPVVLVVGLRLGCINHALLSAESIRNRGANLWGWIANTLDPDMPRLEQNLDTLEALLEAPLLGRIPFLGGQPPASAADALLAGLERRLG